MVLNFDFDSRLKNLRRKLSDEKLDGILITKIANVAYFSGFRGDSSALLVTEGKLLFVTDNRYTEQAKQQTRNFEIITHEEGLYKKIIALVRGSAIKNFGFEGCSLTFDEYDTIKKNLPDVNLKSVELDSLRQIKDSAEIFCVRKACEIADKAFNEILNFIKPDISEIEIAACLENVMRCAGSERPSFETIVASGVRGSLPHGTASDKKISSGEFVTMDFGATFNGYCSDMTRTVFVGKATDRQREIYNTVLDAQLHGLDVIKIGVSGRAADSAVREKLNVAGLGKFFSHALGHSLGLEIHEEPRLSRFSKCERLEENMLVTDEPGVYVPNVGGLRIEDTVLVTKNGAETLTRSPKNLIEIF